MIVTNPMCLLSPRISSRYSIGHRLGSGASATVMSATRKSDQLRVAIKCIPRSLMPDSRLVYDKDPRGRQVVLPCEVYILRRLSHSNIVKLVDYQCDSTCHYIITELFGYSWDSADSRDSSSVKQKAKPVDLFECIESNGRLDQQTSLKIVGQLLDAMAYLRSMNVWHLDLKDENILVDRNYNIKIIDFGNSKVIPAVSKSDRKDGAEITGFCGTLAYTPPEVFTGNPYSPEKADIWSCGLILHTMIFGVLPADSKKQPLDELTQPCRLLLSRMVEMDAEKRVDIDGAIAIAGSV
eukprot:Partr_v1_DN28372_c0_g1_i1_m78821 putative PAS domain containing serine threonine kinase